MYLSFDFDPMLSISVERQVIEKAGMRQDFPHSNSKPRDLSGYVSDVDWKSFNDDFDKMDKEQRVKELYEVVRQIAVDVYMVDEKLDETTAKGLVESAVSDDFYESCLKRVDSYEPGQVIKEEVVVQVVDKEKSSGIKVHYKNEARSVETVVTPDKIVLSMASSLCAEINRIVFTAAMELNLQNFRYIFPTSVMAHDPAHIIRRINDPSYVMSVEDTKKHFATRADQSFPIMNSFSIYEVLKTCDSESQVLQSAGRYQLLKRSFEESKESQVKDDSKKLLAGDGDDSE